MPEGSVFNIQRYSLQDGPGIRTIVFLKGCPLRCQWCSNPESQMSFPEVTHSAVLCNKCGRCLKVCPVQAISLNDGKISFDRKTCTNCAKCVDVCYPQALKLIGKKMSENEILAEVKRDEAYYVNSGGGVTASGGEPLVQPELMVPLFKRCNTMGLHTAIETCGHVPEHILKEILGYTDLVLYDLKHMDTETHTSLTGVSNKLIIDNLRMVAKSGVPTVIRIPLIPGVNDSEENMRATANLMLELGLKKVHLLPYHRYGVKKYEMLDREYELAELKVTSEEYVEKAKKILESYGLDCEIVK